MCGSVFDTEEAGRVLRDDEGVELPSLDQAEREALAALGDMAKDALPHGCPHITMQVRDDQGTVLVTVALSLQVERRA